MQRLSDDEYLKLSANLQIPVYESQVTVVKMYLNYTSNLQLILEDNITEVFPGLNLSLSSISSGAMQIECEPGSVLSSESLNCGKQPLLMT